MKTQKSPKMKLSEGHVHSLMAQQAFHLACWHMGKAVEKTYVLKVISDWEKRIKDLKKRAAKRVKEK
ncbi:MAG: hypothetical protein AYK22_04765 [Thermoplasmatales archaeon SG8-52-3]|nr:MAG: hypothetical protein AYK22_04765 [Thermoplasmatales archaeon SG8-52-3]